MSDRPRLALAWGFVSLVVPAMVILVVWAPVFSYNRIPEVGVAAPAIRDARNAPSDAVLGELVGFDLLPIEGLDRAHEIAAADSLLQGRVELPNRPPSHIGLPFSPEDFEGLPGSLQLWFAGYGVPDLLLAAYGATGREAYLAQARDTILAWDQYERTSPQPTGLLWNDHAISARVRVLGEFWRQYRHRPDATDAIAQVVLEQAARYRALLADPGRFTFATNHGMMQNLALLHLDAAFPTLPDSAHFRQLALDRLDRQLSFLVDDQGVFRENSAGYQAFDVRLLGMTFRCMTLLGVPIPTAWADKYDAGVAMLGRLARPDGTLPAIGDTDAAPQAPPLVAAVSGGATDALGPERADPPDRASVLDATAGYWISWDGLAGWPDEARVAQTVVTWTAPPSASHKHADELGVQVWAKGVSWLTGVGYWPYDDASRADAESWPGANAPHQPGEDTLSDRTAKVLASGASGQLSAIDLERVGPGGYSARRQVVHVGADLWLIVDHVEAAGGAGNETVWQLPADVAVQPGDAAGAYRLEAADHAAAAGLSVLGSDGSNVHVERGSREPFAGWQVNDSVPDPATAVVVDQPPGEPWTAVALTTAPDPGGAPATMSDHDGAESWTMTVPAADGPWTVSWADGTVTATRGSGNTPASASLALTTVPGTARDDGSIVGAFNAVAAAYPQFQERASARTKVTLGIAALAVVLVVVLLVIRRIRPKLLIPAGAGAVVAWAALALVLSLVVLPGWQVMAPT